MSEIDFHHEDYENLAINFSPPARQNVPSNRAGQFDLILGAAAVAKNLR
jgi:hypothetical protein